MFEPNNSKNKSIKRKFHRLKYKNVDLDGKSNSRIIPEQQLQNDPG